MTFEGLLDRISPRLKAISGRLNGRYGFFDKDDLYQEALIHLWQKYESGKLSDKTDSYILQGAFFFLKNYIRTAYRKLDSESTSLNAIADTENSSLEDVMFVKAPEDEFGFIVVNILVEDILSCLDRREREIFLLALEERTTREIGRELGISHVMVVKIEKCIREKCSRIRKDLAR